MIQSSTPHFSTAALLHRQGIYGEEELRLFNEHVTYKKISREQMLLSPGQIAQSAYFIISGAAYQYVLKNEIEEQVIDLHTQDEWMLNHSSFVSRKPSTVYMKVFADAELLEISINSLHQLIAIQPRFIRLGRILEEINYRLRFFDEQHSPQEKYAFVMKEKPVWLQKFPLKMIASYLKITPETLSRVREKFASADKT
jgi:CRP-like cAMP-binding protein